ncbi:unnamed protein product [Vitrella brassicaformis CCMP3155]|uniref:Uncharacterized protein n=1 Tax=Vitrella brassicaformis (strain CCMP3155) TaxID=1169540 RepID=A0A0G4GA56_VITBC|nr:unnamed protein product [Vitrella brassicaformis CCMP3155]|eukprot:CEM25447.1 unnamed protein product [Vitrella brassicaformis CCMP3155]
MLRSDRTLKSVTTDEVLHFCSAPDDESDMRLTSDIDVAEVVTTTYPLIPVDMSSTERQLHINRPLNSASSCDCLLGAANGRR